MAKEFSKDFGEIGQENKEVKECLARNPVFVVGVPRSGTTMLYNILVRHPSFMGKTEPIWNTETSIFKKYIRHTNGFFEEGTWPFWYEYFNGDKYYFREFQKESIRSFLVNAALARGSSRILEKTPNHIETLDFIFEVFPQALAVHIVRHPVDVYASMKERALITPPGKDPWLKTNPGDFATDYARKVSSTEKFENLGLLLTTRYEDLTRLAQEEVKKVCEFIGELFDPHIINGNEPVRATGKFPYQSNVPIQNSRQRQEVLGRNEMNEIQAVCLEVMQKYGYEKY